MQDYSTHLIDMERYAKKATSYLEAAQSLGPSAQQLCYVNAECKLLEAIASARAALACVRHKHG